MKPVSAVLLIAALAAFGGLLYYNISGGEDPASCPGHWHSTFGIFTPNPDDGSPWRLDLGGPRDGTGGNYYQLGHYTAMTIAAHMHQSGPEQGSTALGVSQMHYEGNKCVSVRAAMKAIDVAVSDGSLTISGQHSQTSHTGTWSNDGDKQVHFWLQAWDGNHWTWQEKDIADYLGKQIGDGESFLIAYGHYTDAQVKAMQDQVPAPISRTTPTSTATETSSPGEDAAHHNATSTATARAE